MNERIVSPDLPLSLENKYPGIMEHVHQLSPELYLENEEWLCISGNNPVGGIIGRGTSQLEALEEWEKCWMEVSKSL